MKEAETASIADMIAEVLTDPTNETTFVKVKTRVHTLTAKFPLPY